MRRFVVFLLVANVALFLWTQQDPRHGNSRTATSPPDIGRLRLLNELDAPAENLDLVPQDAGDVRENDAFDNTRNPPVTSSIAPDLPATDALDAADARETSDTLEAPDASTVPEELDALVQPPALATAPLPEAEEARARPAASLSAPRCFNVGPFRVDDAAGFQRRLPTAVIVVDESVEAIDEAQGFYVVVPPLVDRKAGLAKLKELQAAGFNDTWLFRRGELRNAISMGMFSRRASAKRHAAKVKAKGFDVEIRAKSTRNNRKWLRLEDAEGRDLRDLLKAPAGVEITPAKCAV